MSTLTFPKDVSTLRTGADHLLVVAPAKVFSRRGTGRAGLAKALGKDKANRVVDLAADVKPGLLGAVATTLTGGKPRRLSVAVLPDDGSRYNTPSRAEAIRKMVAASGVAKAEHGAVLLVLDHADHQLAAVNAVGRTLPLFTLKSGKGKKRQLRVLSVNRSGAVLATTPVARETCLAGREAARLVDTPPTDMNPEALATEARALLRGIPGVTIKVITGDALLRAKLGGIHGVGRTAVVPPRMVVATYGASKKGKHIALVGKGITYDTGGLHLKARGGMEGMKCDMGGSAAVLGAFRVLAKTKCKCRVTMILCLAENAIGPASYKPDDVLTMHSGKTVEINNTDAEGRLVLADGVSYAARNLKADVILDAATLTGAQMIATGQLHAAVMSNDRKVEHVLVQAGLHSGDLVHPLPFAPEFYKSEFNSPVADMRNSVKNRNNAQSSCAGEFIHWHIEDTKAKWGHVDLAGPAMRFDRGTGYGVALLSEAVRRLA